MQRILALLFLFSAATLASPVAHSSDFEITPSLYFFNYREYNQNNQLLDKETGVLPGLKLTLNQSLDQQTLSLHGALYGGTIDYTGQTQGGIPHDTDTETLLFNTGLRIGQTLGRLTPGQLFLGLQYWYWDRDILTRNNVQGLHEIYYWYEVELGIHRDWYTAQQSRFWMEVSGLYVLSPKMDIDLPSSDLTLDLGSEFGFRFRAGNTWQTGDDRYLSLNFFLERWEFGRSNTVFTYDFYGDAAYLTEPRSESLHMGLEFSYIRHF